jgi:hypothetical protein
MGIVLYAERSGTFSETNKPGDFGRKEKGAMPQTSKLLQEACFGES